MQQSREHALAEFDARAIAQRARARADDEKFNQDLDRFMQAHRLGGEPISEGELARWFPTGQYNQRALAEVPKPEEIVDPVAYATNPVARQKVPAWARISKKSARENGELKAYETIPAQQYCEEYILLNPGLKAAEKLWDNITIYIRGRGVKPTRP